MKEENSQQATKRNPYLWVPSVYYTEGYPLTLVMRMGNMFLTYMNVPVQALGIFSGIFGLPWAFKFLWSPAVDFFGSKRKWIITLQGLLAFMFVAITVMVFAPGGMSVHAVKLVVPNTDNIWLALNMLIYLTLLFSILFGIDSTRPAAVRLLCAALGAGALALTFVYKSHLYMPAQLSLPAHIWMLAIAFFATAVLSATHDVAIDGYYIDALDKDGQTKFSGLRVSAYRVAMIVGGGLLVMLSGRFGWGVVFASGTAIFVALLVFNSIYLPVLPVRQSRTDASGKGISIVGAFTSYMDQKRILFILLFILLYRLGDFLWNPMAMPFLKEIGVAKEQAGFIAGFVGPISAILGGILGGIYISKKGLTRGLWVLGIVQNVTLLLYVYLSLVHHKAAEISFAGLLHVAAVNAFENFAYGVGTVAFVNFLMRTCKKEYSAIHYAIATGFTAIANTFAGFLSGFLAVKIGYTHFFALCFLCSIPGLAVLLFLPLKEMEAQQS